MKNIILMLAVLATTLQQRLLLLSQFVRTADGNSRCRAGLPATDLPAPTCAAPCATCAPAAVAVQVPPVTTGYARRTKRVEASALD